MAFLFFVIGLLIAYFVWRYTSRKYIEKGRSKFFSNFTGVMWGFISSTVITMVLAMIFLDTTNVPAEEVETDVSTKGVGIPIKNIPNENPNVFSELYTNDGISTHSDDSFYNAYNNSHNRIVTSIWFAQNNDDPNTEFFIVNIPINLIQNAQNGTVINKSGFGFRHGGGIYGECKMNGLEMDLNDCVNLGAHLGSYEFSTTDSLIEDIPKSTMRIEMKKFDKKNKIAIIKVEATLDHVVDSTDYSKPTEHIKKYFETTDITISGKYFDKLIATSPSPE